MRRSHMHHLLKLMGKLGVNDVAGQKPSSPERLYDATAELQRQAKNIAARADRLRNVPRGEKPIQVSDQMELFSLMHDCDKIADVAHTVSQTIVDCVIDSLPLLGKADKTQKKILTHFQKQIKNIIRMVLDDAGDGGALWMVAEECYNQASPSSGALHSDYYYINLDEATLRWPYDPKYESEEDYDHKNRLDTDEGYAEVFRQLCERRAKAGDRRNEEWVNSWVRTLHACPKEPTLFYPPATPVVIEQDWLCYPPKLIRTFDRTSSGISSSRVIASIMSIRDPAKSRKDILELRRDKARAQLHGRLEKPLQEGVTSDNLSSWTSSLLFGIQYAIYRSWRFGLSYSEVYICVVDPRDFPQGQFIRDKGLIETYQSSIDGNDGARDFFDFRLRRYDYDNGEYLSQGRVSIEGRSCVVTLDQLGRFGLFKLFPQLADPDGRRRWTNRVRDLRALWSRSQSTIMTEIRTALRIAKECFPRFNAVDTALLFLTLKNRRLIGRSESMDWSEIFQHVLTTSAVSQQDQANRYGPDEVQRYRDLLRKSKSIKNERSGLLDDESILGQLFDCTPEM